MMFQEPDVNVAKYSGITESRMATTSTLRIVLTWVTAG
jgi:hypothetical protein